MLGHHSFSTHAKVSEKLTLPSETHNNVREKC